MPSRPCLSLALSLALAGCAAIKDKVAESPILQAAGIVPDQPCTVTPIEGRRLGGIYLRKVAAVEQYDLIVLDGALRKSGLPRNVRIDDRRIRRIEPGAGGALTGSHQALAEPVPEFGGGGLPGLYTLSYQAGDVAYSGPAAVGPGPAGTELPDSGKAEYSGRVLMRIAADGEATRAAGRIDLTVERGTGQASANITELVVLAGPPPGFTGISWRGLGICGARVGSTGQGRLRLVAANGGRVAPDLPGQGGALFRAEFDAFQFAADDRPGPPRQAGGAFLIAGAASTITGYFLTD